MPLGLKNAPAVFQQLMDKVLSSYRDCASTYIDDVFVYSADWEVHKKDLGRVLAALESAGIPAKPGKCQFGRQQAACRISGACNRLWVFGYSGT